MFVNLERERRAMGSVSIVIALVLACFATLLVFEVPTVEAYTTPDLGVVWNMDDLVANSGGAVSLISPGNYRVREDIFISPSDTIIVQAGENVYMDGMVSWGVNGGFLVGGSGGEVSIISYAVTPAPGDWGDIRVMDGQFYAWNTTIEHGNRAVRVGSGICDLSNTTIANTSSEAIEFSSGSMFIRDSSIYGSSTTLPTGPGKIGIYIYSNGPSTIILENNTITGGDGKGNLPGGPAVFNERLIGGLSIRNNKLIRGGDGGPSTVAGDTAGSGGHGLQIDDFPNYGMIPSINITGNEEIRGGTGGPNLADNGNGGYGGMAMLITDLPPLGAVRIEDNLLIQGGDGGDNYGNATAGPVEGGDGGNAIYFSEIGPNSTISGNDLISGGAGGDNHGLGAVNFQSVAGAGGGGLAPSSPHQLNIIDTIVTGGKGGDNSVGGAEVKAGNGGYGIHSFTFGFLDIIDSEVMGGAGGTDWANVGTGAWSGGGIGGNGIDHGGQPVMLNLTNTNVTGGRGGDNHATPGSGSGTGGSALVLGTADHLDATGGRIEGGRGGDNFMGVITAGNGAQGLFGQGIPQNVVIDGTEIIGGGGGDVLNGSGMGGNGAYGASISGVTGNFLLSNSPLIAAGPAGLNKSSGVDGIAGLLGLWLMNVGGSSQVMGNFFGNAYSAGASISTRTLVMNNAVSGPPYGVSLSGASASNSIIANLTFSGFPAGGTGISLLSASDIIITTIDVDAGRGVSLIDSNAQIYYADINASTYAIYAANSTAYVENSTFTGSLLPQNTFYLTAGSNITTLNVTFPYADIQFIDANSTLTVQNFLHVHVRDAGLSPITGADVQILDNAATVYASSGFGGSDAQTGTDGSVSWTVVTDRMYIGASAPIENATTAEVSFGAIPFDNNPRSVDMSTTHTEVFTEIIPDIWPPVITNVNLLGAVGGRTGGAHNINVTAVIDDSIWGGSNIVGANFTFGSGNWSSAQPMTALDGYDSPTESVYGVFNTNVLPYGITDICVYGEDDWPNYNLTGSCVPLFVDNQGPQILSMMFNGMVPPITVMVGDMITVTADLDDDSLISHANATIDSAPTLPMSALDGAWDSPSETAFVIVDTTGFPTGLHTICIEAVDEFGNNRTNCGNFTVLPDSLAPQILYTQLNGLTTLKIGVATVRITTSLLDTASIIGGANYTIGPANWSSSQPMIPTDGVLDSTSEDFYADLWVPTLVLSGTYQICVYGWDSMPNYNLTGLCSVLIVDLTPPAVYSILFNGAPPPVSVPLGQPVNITAIADDTGLGDSFILSSSWVNITFPHVENFSALDGSFDSTNESLYVVVPTTGVPIGSYMACLYIGDEHWNVIVYCEVLWIVDALPPAVNMVATNPSQVGSATSVNLTATIDDTMLGNSNITNANYTIGAGNWASSQPMLPVDGSFDGPVEDVYVLLNSDDFATGQYTLCVYAWDEVLNFNTVGSCASLQVDKFGPEIQSLAFDGSAPPVTAGWGTTVSVTASLLEQFNTQIVGATMKVDTVAVGAMSAVDGSFDSNAEDVEGLLDASSMSLGNHDVCAEAEDFYGNLNETCGVLTLVDLAPPMISNVALDGLSTLSVTMGTDVTVTADIDDIGGSTVASANFTVGGNWASSQALDAADGTYDDVSESVTGTLDTSSLTLGDHSICVYATDSESNGNTTGECVTLTIVDLTPPTISNVALEGEVSLSVTQGTLVNITADISDLGGAVVASANFTVDGDWAFSQALDASDGTYDGTSESVDGVLDTSSLSAGDHTICVYATDSASNENTTGSCVSLTITIPSDTTPPTVVSHQPSSSATDVSVEAEIIIVFSEPMNTSSAGSSIEVTPSFDYQISWNGDTMTITPTGDLEYGTTYEITISATAATDLANNLLDGNNDGTGGDNLVWSFTTEEREEGAAETDWTFIFVAIGIVVVIVFLLLFMLRRRKAAPAEEEALEEEELLYEEEEGAGYEEEEPLSEDELLEELIELGDETLDEDEV